MRWGLLFSDSLARIMGVLGLVASLVWIGGAKTVATNGGPMTNFVVGGAVFCTALTLVFLMPQIHRRMIGRTLGKLPRFGFLLLCLPWVAVVAAGFYALESGLEDVLPDLTPMSIWPFATVAVLTLFAILVFPFGLSWRMARRNGVMPPRPGKPAKAVSADVDSDLYNAHEVPEDMPVYRVKQAWAEHSETRTEAAMDDATNSWTSTRPKDDLPVFVAPQSQTRAQKAATRESDAFDVFTSLPAAIIAFGSLVALRVGNTVQTADWDAWLDANWIVGLLAVAGIAILPALLNKTLRRPIKSQNKPGAVRRFLVTLVVTPVLSAALFIFGGYDGLPTAWNMVMEAPVETQTYTFVELETGRHLDGCARLHHAGTPDREVMICSLDETMLAELVPGAQIEATGALSQFGHTFDEVRLLP